MSNQQFKADGGKTRPDLISIGFARALRMVQATTDYGAIKYEADSWRYVEDGIQRYTAAAERHRQARMLEQTSTSNELVLEPVDEESGLPHIAHEVFCLLAIMELSYSKFYHNGVHMNSFTSFNIPPLDHKESK